MYIFFKVSEDAVDVLFSSGKKWFVYLSKALQKSTKNESCLVDYYVEYDKHLRHLKEWCHPHANVMDVKLWPAGSNLLKFLPCGFVNDVKKHNDKIVKWQITVNIAFSLNVTFLRFEFQDSGEECSSTNLKIVEHRHGGWRSRWYWTYCGYRRPWSDTILSNKGLLIINQKDLRYSYNVSFMYYTINGDNYFGSKLYFKENIPYGQREVYYHIENSHYIRWIIKLHICYVTHFSVVKLINFVGQFDIYDGPSEKYSIFSLSHTTRETFVDDVDAVSQYYSTVVKIMPHRSNNNFNGSKVMHLSFEKKMRETRALLNLNSRTRIHNDGHIFLAAVYSISGEAGQYPNVTFNIRKFEGWNEGGCNMGGFAFVQQMPGENKTLVTSGPYCPGGSSNQPFITEHGPQYIVLSSKETLLVIYAHGPEYRIDLDVMVSVSLCEGMFDFPLLCEAELAVTHTAYTFLHWNNLEVTCIRLHQLNDFFLGVQLLKVTGCAVAQVIMSWRVLAIQVELLSRMHVNFEYISPIRHNISYVSIMPIFWRDIESGSQYVKLLNTSKNLDIGDVTSLTCVPETKVLHHDSSWTMIMLQIDRKVESIAEHCELRNQSTISQSFQIHQEIEYIVQLSTLCFTSYYQKFSTYLFQIIPSGIITHNSSLSNAYFDIQEQNCGDLTPVLSNLTIAIRLEFTQTFHITTNETIEIEVPNVPIIMVVEKYKVCSTIIFQYRVALMTLHDVTRTAIIEERFQVFIKSSKHIQFTVCKCNCIYFYIYI